jgi:hypothetical protein
MSEDAELLRQYAQSGSETAFMVLVSRYLPVAQSSAFRQTEHPPYRHSERGCHRQQSFSAFSC